MPKLLFVCAFLLVNNLSAQCPYFILSPSAAPFYCDYSNNNPLLWKAGPYTWNPTLQLTDLPEAEVDLNIAVKDSCGGLPLQIAYTLFLDLNGDDSTETVIQSDHLPPAGRVLFNNISSPNYSNGDTLQFDWHASSMQSRFGLQVEHLGDSMVATVAWMSGLGQQNYILPQLPLGKHRIVWRVEQGGVEQFYAYAFEVKDCAAPVFSCLNSLSVNILPNGLIPLWASDLMNGIATDNVTPANLIYLGIRKLSDNGTGFPFDNNGLPVTSVTFNCFDAWFTPQLHVVEVWVIDKAGNADSCLVNVYVGLGGWDCNFDPTILRSCSQTVANEDIENVSSKVEGEGPFIAPFSITKQSGNNGCAVFLGEIACSSNFTIVPSRKDNPLNGVTTYDLVLIAKHILGIEPLNSPYKMIAADVNKSGSITTYDIAILRKAILGYYDTLPNNDSWRFIQSGFIFPNPQNPFETDLPDTLSLHNWQCYGNYFFTGIKVGDVNNTAIPNAQDSIPVDSRSPLFLVLPDIELKAGETVEVPLQSTQGMDWAGFQMGLSFDTDLMELESIASTALPEFEENNWAKPFAGRLNVSWSAAQPISVLPGVTLLQLKFKARKPLVLSKVLHMELNSALHGEVYDKEGRIQPLQLVYAALDASQNAMVFIPQPNPTTAGVAIPVQLSQAEQLLIELRDLNGVLCWKQSFSLEPGSRQLEIPAAAMDLSGQYLWRVQTDKWVKSGKIIKI